MGVAVGGIRVGVAGTAVGAGWVGVAGICVTTTVGTSVVCAGVVVSPGI